MPEEFLKVWVSLTQMPVGTQWLFVLFLFCAVVWGAVRLGQRRPMAPGFMEYMFACGSFFGALYFLLMLYLIQGDQSCKVFAGYDALFPALGGVVVTYRAGAIVWEALFDASRNVKRPPKAGNVA